MAKIRAFAGQDASIDEETTNHGTLTLTYTTYHPNDEVKVMLGKAEFKSVSDVVF